MHPKPRAEDLPGHRVVAIDKPVIVTEYYSSRRVFQVKLGNVGDGTLGFSFALEFDNQILSADGRDRELQLEFPHSDAKAFLLVTGERGRSYYSAKPRGTARLRQLKDNSVLYVDLEFESAEHDAATVVPEHIFKEDPTHLRITGTFTAG